MTIYKGSTKIGTIKIGSANIKKALKGNTIVFGKEVFEKIFTASGSITFPSTLFALYAAVVGGGGNGGNGTVAGNLFWTGSGGGSGGCAMKTFNSTEINNLKGKTVSFTVGAATKASAFQNMRANPGANGTPANSSGGAGGTASGGEINLTGNQGGSSGGYYSGGGGAASVWNGYGAGGNGGAGYNGGSSGGSGCVYIRYEY